MDGMDRMDEWARGRVVWLDREVGEPNAVRRGRVFKMSELVVVRGRVVPCFFSGRHEADEPNDPLLQALRG